MDIYHDFTTNYPLLFMQILIKGSLNIRFLKTHQFKIIRLIERHETYKTYNYPRYNLSNKEVVENYDPT